MRDLLLFTHIPKTAGITFLHVVSAQYRMRQIHNARGASPDTVKLIATLRKKKAIRFVRGHFGFGVHELIDRSSRYLCFLREPIARVISHYYFHCHVHDAVPDWVAFCASHENTMTRYLSGAKFTAAYSGAPPEPTDQATLEAAKSNLQQHYWFGITERFDESILLFRNRLAWDIPCYKSRNITPKKPVSPEPQDILSLIERHNRFDIELYAFANELFDQTLATQPWNLEQELNEFRTRNDTPAARNAAAVQSLRLFMPKFKFRARVELQKLRNLIRQGRT